ncbi:MAG: sulfotransferase [Actinomycetia bacterium]|nr:sulfotransferase [Actinomycetes bacterium]MCP4959413.1 sulfotransferase [Actinomycetes bacterium]
MSNDPVRILFLAGLGRSGSTIVANVLGQHSNAVSIGELVHLWARGLADNELCGCAKPLQECEFWTRVGELAFGGWSQLDLDEVMSLQGRVDRNRYIPLMVFPKLHPRRALDQQRYTDILLRIYRAIRDVSGAEVIVDSTKHVSYAYLLSQIEGIDVSVAHLVRESQGVAYSWAKTIERPEVTSGHDEMPRYSPARTSSKWLSYNLMLHGLRAVGTPRRLVRYEDAMRDPRAQIALLMEFAGLVPLELDHIGDGWVELTATHTVAGNPSRFNHGRVDLRLDRAWVDMMEERDKRIVGALTWPLSTAYGYRKQDNR